MVFLDQVARVVKCAKQLQRVMDQFLPQLEEDFSLVDEVRGVIHNDREELLKAISEAFPDTEPPELESQVAAIVNTVRMLGVIGYRYDGSPLVQRQGEPPRLRRLSETMLREFSAATNSLAKYCENQAESAQARKEALDAIREDLFLEWVQRCPGRGAAAELGPFKRNVKYDSQIDEGPYCWEVTTIYKYLTANPKEHIWVDCTTSYHREVDVDLGTNVTIIDEGTAARIVKDSDEPLDVEVIKWAKENAAPPPQPPRLAPNWDPKTRTLTLNGKILRKFVSRAKNCEMVLGCFQDDDWPSRIDSPFSPGAATLGDTIKYLNGCVEDVEFNADGDGVGWKLKVEPESSPEDWYP